MSVILIGTAGYSYKDWKGVFYPEGLPDKEMLGFYAGQFPFTEINTTFYRMPNPFMLSNMAAKTPPKFHFFIKAFQGLTHKRDAELFPEFVAALSPLASEGRLAGVLAQFPNSFRKNPDNRAYLGRFRDALGPDIPVVVEFRHREWVEDETTFDLLAELNLSFVCVDEPQFKSLVPPLFRATATPAYVRFHGRNYQKWWHHDHPDERYDYLYTEEELTQWIPRLHALERSADTVYVSMNNHRRGQAVINGRMLRDLLERSLPSPDLDFGPEEVILTDQP
jgi:uncharacterized protein YecE (DUF72 family)